MAISRITMSISLLPSERSQDCVPCVQHVISNIIYVQSSEGGLCAAGDHGCHTEPAMILYD